MNALPDKDPSENPICSIDLPDSVVVEEYTIEKPGFLKGIYNLTDSRNMLYEINRPINLKDYWQHGRVIYADFSQEGLSISLTKKTGNCVLLAVIKSEYFASMSVKLPSQE